MKHNPSECRLGTGPLPPASIAQDTIQELPRRFTQYSHHPYTQETFHKTDRTVRTTRYDNIVGHQQTVDPATLVYLLCYCPCSLSPSGQSAVLLILPSLFFSTCSTKLILQGIIMKTFLAQNQVKIGGQQPLTSFHGSGNGNTSNTPPLFDAPYFSHG